MPAACNLPWGPNVHPCLPGDAAARFRAWAQYVRRNTLRSFEGMPALLLTSVLSWPDYFCSLDLSPKGKLEDELEAR